MHYHFANPQLLVGGFALLLTLIFALAAVLESRVGRPAPLRNLFRTGFDRNLFADSRANEATHGVEDEFIIFSDIDVAYLDSLGVAANSCDARRVKRE